jgi:hypothetical protein
MIHINVDGEAQVHGFTEIKRTFTHATAVSPTSTFTAFTP